MANKRFWVGMLAMVLVFGMTVVGCDNGTTSGNGGGGTLTITDIPAAHDNMYAYFAWYNAATGGELWGAQNVSMAGTTLARVINGTVSLPMWEITVDGRWSRYSGSATINGGELFIFSSSTLNWDNEVDRINLGQIIFSSGNATVSAQ